MFQFQFGAYRGFARIWVSPLSSLDEPSKLQDKTEKSDWGHFYFLHQTPVSSKPWCKSTVEPANSCSIAVTDLSHVLGQDVSSKTAPLADLLS